MFESLGVELRYEKAPEPTDIIWENLEYSDLQRNFFMGINVIISAVLLLITLFIFIGIKSKAAEALTKFPARMECS